MKLSPVILWPISEGTSVAPDPSPSSLAMFGVASEWVVEAPAIEPCLCEECVAAGRRLHEFLKGAP